MLRLHDLQQLFIDGLIGKNQVIIEHIRADKTLSAAAHLAIYQSSCIGVLQKALTDVYPVCHKLVGADFFIGMITEYIYHHPSYSPNLSEYGEHLADFILTVEPAKSVPYLSDVARLEWAWHQISDADHQYKTDLSKLAEHAVLFKEKLIFSLPEKSTLLTSIYPIHEIWQANQENFDGDQTIVLPNNAQFYYLIWRKELIMRIDLLSLAEWQILSWMQAKHTLGEIYEKLTELLPTIDFERMLPAIVKQGWAKV
ncbi:MAG TPA: DNA-binding domain-containing protein [Gammaproteobacteria bacterium]|jgi:hypothetical protein|nr:DNA-binding domain-containing protein [Gammaproteobacteria bacterium]